MDARRLRDRHPSAAAVAVAALVLTGCAVERVEDVEDATAVEPADEASPSPDGAAGAEAGREEAGREPDDEDPPPRDVAGQGQQQEAGSPGEPPALTFPMPNFPGTVTGGNIEQALADACEADEPCVDYVLIDEHHDEIEEGKYIRSEPSSGEPFAPGDTVTIWRSLGPKDRGDAGDGDEPDPGDDEGATEQDAEGEGSDGGSEPASDSDGDGQP